MQNGFKKKKYFIAIVIILLISLSINIMLCLKNKQYSHRIGANSYKNIETIKIKNEKNIEIIDKTIDTLKISNGELLNLYTNYSDMSDCIIKLWDDYNFYNETDRGIFINKKIDTSKVIENDIYSRIENYLGNTLINIMSTDSDDLVVKGKDLEDFEVMKSLAINMSKIFSSIDESKLGNVNNSDKEKKVIDNKYWIDILREIDKTSSKYIDYDFIKEVKVTKAIY